MSADTFSETTLKQSVSSERLSVFDTPQKDSKADIKKHFAWIPKFVFTGKTSTNAGDCDGLCIPTLEQLIIWMRVPLNKDVFTITLGDTYKFSASSEGDGMVLTSKFPKVMAPSFQQIKKEFCKHQGLEPSERDPALDLALVSFANSSLTIWLDLYMKNAVAQILYQLDGVHTVEEDKNSHAFIVYVHPDRRSAFLTEHPELFATDSKVRVEFEPPIEWENDSSLLSSVGQK